MSFSGNRTSGSNEGEIVLSAFRRVLNHAQVIDLVDKSPEEALHWCRLLPEHTCRVIVAGGDGSIGWVLNTIYKMKLKVSSLTYISSQNCSYFFSKLYSFIKFKKKSHASLAHLR